ncbi:MAG TPA: HK97 family phage prohead protease [Steroidobacteraceae bacterium]|nr:HK97 family phage prohead protease [Steroidobacteraceae bacterium]
MDRCSRLAPSATVNPDAGTRTVDYLFSDESVGRDGHIVKNSAWRLDNFNANPVFMFQHDDSVPPIGRVLNLRVAAGALRGSVRYAETEFAETIYQLVRGGFLSAVSTSWQPIAYDPMPNGRGVIFIAVDLLEISQVAVPALPSALATARGAVNTKPLYQWAERALDTGRLCSIDRSLLQAVHRAAKPLAASGSDSIYTREGRIRRARELAAQDRSRVSEIETPEGRARRAGQLLRKAIGTDRSALRQVSRHLTHAADHHAKLSNHHDMLGDHVRAAREAHRRVTSTLKELGERSARTTSTLAALGYDHGKVTRALSELGDALGAIAKAHGDADDVAQSACEQVREAKAGVDGILGGGENE